HRRRCHSMRFTRLGKDAGPLQPFRGGGGRQESRGNALKCTSGCTEGLHGALESTRVRESAHLVAPRFRLASMHGETPSRCMLGVVSTEGLSRPTARYSARPGF